MMMNTNKALESLESHKLNNIELNEVKGGIDWRWRRNVTYTTDCGLEYTQEETWWGLYGTSNFD